MPAVELMELADEMGFLILSEGFDMWERHKTDYDYAGFSTSGLPQMLLHGYAVTETTHQLSAGA